MSDNQTSSGGGISFLGALAILFIGLKLAGLISWSWWWVLAPLWIGFAVMVSIVVIVLAIGGVIMLRENKRQPVNRKWLR